MVGWQTKVESFPSTRCSSIIRTQAFPSRIILKSTDAEEPRDLTLEKSDLTPASIGTGNIGSPEGYLSTDLGSIGDGKQLRVLTYIALSLIPCLFLIPFFLSRDFVPPVDPDFLKQ
eukprot:gene7383-15074_t